VNSDRPCGHDSSGKRSPKEAVRPIAQRQLSPVFFAAQRCAKFRSRRTDRSNLKCFFGHRVRCLLRSISSFIKDVMTDKKGGAAQMPPRLYQPPSSKSIPRGVTVRGPTEHTLYKVHSRPRNTERADMTKVLVAVEGRADPGAVWQTRRGCRRSRMTRQLQKS